MTRLAPPHLGADLGFPQTRRAVTWIIVLAALITLISGLHFVVRVTAIRAGSFGDFPLFWAQARSFVHTGILYPHALEEYRGGGHVYKFPPFYAGLLVPALRLSERLRIEPERAFTYHWLLQIAMYLATLVLCVLLLRRTGLGLRTAVTAAGGGAARDGPPGVDRPAVSLSLGLMTVAILGLNYEPFFETLYGLQVETSLLLLITLCLFCFGRGLDAYAGIALALAAMLKLYPVLLLAFFVLERRYKVLAWFAGTCIVVLGWSILIIGPDQCRLYFSEILPYMMDAPAAVTGGNETDNLAFAKYIQWLGIAPGPAKTLGSLIALALLAVTSLLAYRDRRRNSWRMTEPLRYLVFVPLILLALTDSWTNYQLLLLLPIVWVVSHSIVAAWLPRPTLWLMLAACLPLMVDANSGSVLSLFDLFDNPSHYARAMDVRTLSNLLVWAAVAWALARGPRQGETGRLAALPAEHHGHSRGMPLNR